MFNTIALFLLLLHEEQTVEVMIINVSDILVNNCGTH